MRIEEQIKQISKMSCKELVKKMMEDYRKKALKEAYEKVSAKAEK